MDDRLIRLIADRSVHCTLRKQDQRITRWWRERWDEYNRIAAREDASESQTRTVLDRLFGILKFVALPNGDIRKQELIARDWPALEAEIKALL